jgi:hypothetical protein
MAWPHPFRRRDENTRTCWGYTFQLTPEHLTLEQSHPLKHSYDILGEECLDILNELSPPEPRSSHKHVPSTTSDQEVKPPSPTKPTKPKRDLYALLLQHKDSHPKLAELYNNACNPPWPVDWDQIARGQDVFYRYAGANLTGLAYQSLLGGMGAARVVETLTRTGGFNVAVARHRLFETAQHILECTRDLTSIQPDGDGFASSLRVRLLHAAVRKRILTLTKTHPTYYSVADWGIPINDLDCIATIASFSSTLLFISLPRQGLYVTSQEAEDYVALWRLIAHYTATPTDPFANAFKAKCAMESLLMHEIRPSKTSGVLANNIIRALENTPPAYASRSFLEVSARWMNGNELCDELGLGRPSAWYWALMAGQCLFFMGVCYFYRSFEGLDRRKVKGLRKILWAFLVEGKMGLDGQKATFEFKWVPDLGVGTERGGDEEKRGRERGVEARSLRTLVVVAAGLGAATWIGLKVAERALGMLW